MSCLAALQLRRGRRSKRSSNLVDGDSRFLYRADEEDKLGFLKEGSENIFDISYFMCYIGLSVYSLDFIFWNLCNVIILDCCTSLVVTRGAVDYFPYVLLQYRHTNFVLDSCTKYINPWKSNFNKKEKL